MRSIFLLFLTQISLCQTTLKVYVNNTHSKYANFERELIETIISIHERKTRTHFDVTFNELDQFATILDQVSETDHMAKRLAINSISITKERLKRFSFSIPYFKNKYCLFSSNVSKVDSSQSSFSVGVLDGSSHSKLMHLFPPHLKYIHYNSFTKRLSDLDSGKINFIIADYIDLWTYNLKLEMLLPIISSDYYGIVFPLNDSFFDSFKETAQYFIESPSYKRLLERHFGKTGLEFLPDKIK